MSNWNAEHFRVTLLGPTSLPSPKEVLPQAFGVEVDSFSERNYGSETNAESDWMGGRLAVRSQPGRLDFIISPIPDVGMNAPMLPDGISVLPHLILAVNNWLVGSNVDVNRIALGGRAMLPSKDRDDAYDKFAEKVKLVSVKKNEQSEINFQVNLPRASKNVSGIKINAVSAWAVSAFKFFQISSNMTSTTGDEQYFLHCVPDISTDADRVGFLLKDDMSKLFDEFRDVFEEFLEEGVS